MAANDSTNILDLENVLKETGLYMYFPVKLTRNKLFSISNFDIESPDKMCLSPKEQTLKVISKLIHYNPHYLFIQCQVDSDNARSLRTKRRVSTLTDQSKALHPLDITTAVFICCDHIAKQDLVEHVWVCKHAFPLILKYEQLEPVKMYIWPMKSLLLSIPINNCTNDVIENRLLNVKMKIVTFLRINKTNISKSDIMNCVISQTEKVHSTFFHRDCEGSTRFRSELCEGMIEAASNISLMLGHVLYLNLRGNALEHKLQREFVCSISNVIFLVCDSGSREDIVRFLNEMKPKHARSNIVIIYIGQTGEEAIELANDLKRRSIEVYIVDITQKRKPEIVADISAIIEGIAKTDARKLEETITIAKEIGIAVDVDEMGSIETSDKISHSIKEFYFTNSLQNVFPLQGNAYLNWASADNDFYKMRLLRKGQSITEYREQLETVKRKSRKEQEKIIGENSHKILDNFTDKLVTATHEQNDTKLFIRNLKLNLDDITRIQLNHLYTQYKSIIFQLSEDQQQERNIQDKLNELDRQFNTCSISIPWFAREMGQIFEVFEAVGTNEENTKHPLVQRLPLAAATLLLFGYQIEIMDGRSNSVPVVWIQSVIKELVNVTGNQNTRIKVVSVLGIQSSGKSTLLNVMFGSQFAVGSRRCTRGAYMHLVKTDQNVQETYQLDYILVVDTEGLFSMESAIDPKKERELATFIIGLANITIVNIMGESIHYLKNILPIAVHAFLRMDLVGLNPKCRLVHHNVDKRSKHTLLAYHHSLENALNEFTAAACRIEGVKNRPFKQIIEFDIANDIDYFPPLYDSNGLVETISTGYSMGAVNLKRLLITDKQASTTMQEFSRHIKCLWEAIKRVNFVHEFRNIIETEARIILDKRFCHVNWNIKQTAKKKLIGLQTKMHNCLTVNEVQTCSEECKAEIKSDIFDKYAILSKDLKNVFKENSKIIANVMKTWKRSTLQEFEAIRDNVLEYSSRYLDQLTQKRRAEIQLLLADVELQVSFIKINSKDESYSNRDEIFDSLWKKWLDSHQGEECHVSEHENMEEHAIIALYDIFVTNRNIVEKELNEKKLNECTFETFRVSERHLQEFPRHMQEDIGHQLKMANQVREDVRKFEINLFERVKEKQIFYDADIFQDIIMKVRNHDLIYRNILKTKASFEIELSVSLCGDLIRMLDNDDIHGRPFTQLALSKAKRNFISLCYCALGRVEDMKHVAANIAEVVKGGIVDLSIEELPSVFVDTLRLQFPFLKSKHCLTLYIHRELLKSEDFSLIHVYLQNPEGSIRTWLCRLFDEYTGIETNVKSVQLDESLHKYVQDVLSKIDEGLRECDALGGFGQGIQTDLLKSAITTMRKKLQTIVPISDIREYENKTVETNDPVIIFQSIRSSIQSIKSDTVHSVNYALLEKHYDVIREKTVASLLDILGCTEVCPFCHELCSISRANHSGEHETFVHKSRGFVGKCLGQSASLVYFTCSEDIDTDAMFKQDVAQHPRWRIQAQPTLEAGSYWKYMFVKYKENIASTLKSSVPEDIPHSWSMLSKENELLKLQKQIQMHLMSE